MIVAFNYLIDFGDAISFQDLVKDIGKIYIRQQKLGKRFRYTTEYVA